MGGWFQKGMRWEDYREHTVEPANERYLNYLRGYIIRHNIFKGRDWHQNQGVAVFNDGTYASFSFRAWGDLMAAIWSTELDTDYSYMDFYLND